MTDKDFSRIKAAFPALRWRRVSSFGGDAAMATLHAWTFSVFFRDGRWMAVVRWWPDRYLEKAHGDVADCQTLGRCLRSLRCAIRREAETLAGMVDGKVIP